MLRKSTVLLLVCLSFVLIGCGVSLVPFRDVRKVHSEANFKFEVEVSVSVAETRDPQLFMYAEDVKYNQEAGKMVVKNAYLSSNQDRDSATIFIEEATFKFKFPTEVKITNHKSN